MRLRECGAADGLRPLRAPDLHAQRRQHLPELVVQLARETLALFLLRPHQLVREPPQLLFGLLRAAVLLLGAAFEHADADDGDDGHRQAQTSRLAASVARQVLMQLALALGRRLLLRVQGAVVDRLDFGGDPHDRIAPRHDLAAQKAIAIDLGRAVEQRRIRAPVIVELAPELAVRPRIGLAQQRLELGDHLFALEVVGDEPRAVLGGRRRRVEQIIARENARKMQAPSAPAAAASRRRDSAY